MTSFEPYIPIGGSLKPFNLVNYIIDAWNTIDLIIRTHDNFDDSAHIPYHWDRGLIKYIIL